MLGAWCGEERGHRLSSEHEDFERALDALRVVRREPRGRLRIDGGEPRMQRGPAVACGIGVERGAHVGIGGGKIVETLRQRLVVQHRAADQQRHIPPRDDLSDQPQRIRAKLRGGISLGGIDDVDQMMRRHRALHRVGLAVPISISR